MSILTSIREWGREALQAAPPGATLTLTLFGVPITAWATVLSICLLLLQGYFLIKNQRRKDRDYQEYLDRRNSGGAGAPWRG